MMLGVNNTGQKWYEALGTFLIILAINVLLLLPEGLPTVEQWYSAIKQGLAIAFTLYALNKGIEWRKKE